MPSSLAPVNSAVSPEARPSDSPAASNPGASEPPNGAHMHDPFAAALLEAQQAFARGDFARTRALAAATLKRNPDAESRAVLELLVTRCQPDPLARWVLVIAGATVLAVTLIAYYQGRATLH
jgi:hypothetical protein